MNQYHEDKKGENTVIIYRWQDYRKAPKYYWKILEWPSEYGKVTGHEINISHYFYFDLSATKIIT